VKRIVGVNLVYGAFHYYDAPERLVESLLDGLSAQRIEVDMIEFTRAAFEGVDNRVMSLRCAGGIGSTLQATAQAARLSHAASRK
jgi:hypothetical protein